MKWVVVWTILGVGLVGGFLFLYMATHIRSPNAPAVPGRSDPAASQGAVPAPENADGTGLDAIDWAEDLPRLRRLTEVEKALPPAQAQKEGVSLAHDLAAAERALKISGTLLTAFEHPAVQERLLEAALREASDALDSASVAKLRGSCPEELDLASRARWAASVVPPRREAVSKDHLRLFDDSCRAIFLFEPDAVRLPVGPGVTRADRHAALLKLWQSTARASLPAGAASAAEGIVSDWLRRGRAAVEDLRKSHGDAVDQALANDKGLSKDPAARSVELRLALRAKMAAIQMLESKKLVALLPERARREALARSQTKIFLVAAEP